MNTLLIVEDEKMIRQGIKAIALRSPVPINNIIECKNGQDALDIIENHTVDVMITDIRMPKMDGITLVKEMQHCAHIPLTVVVSGYDDFSYAVEFLRYGIKEYILKPVDRTQINNILVKLEGEIQATKEKQHRILNIGYQQLKYLMLNKEITSLETEVIMKQFDNIFFEGNYVVCCTNYEEDGFAEQEGITYLMDVDKQGIFIVEEYKLNGLLYEDLSNYNVGCSSLHKGLKELKLAYEEALKARKEAFVTGEHVVVFENNEYEYEDIKDEEIEQIVQMLGTTKIKEVLKNMDHICYRLKMNKINPETFAKITAQLMNKVVSTYKNAIDIDEKETFLQKNLYSYHSAEDYIEAVKRWFIQLNETLMVEFDDYRNKQKIQQAVLYIHEHYNKELNMAVVSNYISMNYSLFSYAFKQYTGCNFVNYLKKIRITEAKRLLETTDMRITEIGLAVGYENDKHFMKIFKSVSGVSPTEYRKNTLLGKELES